MATYLIVTNYFNLLHASSVVIVSVSQAGLRTPTNGIAVAVIELFGYVNSSRQAHAVPCHAMPSPQCNNSPGRRVDEWN